MATKGLRHERPSSGGISTRCFLAALCIGLGTVAAAQEIDEFDIPTPRSEPFGITAGPDGNVWFAEVSFDDAFLYPVSGAIGRISPNGVITEFPAPAATGYSDGLYPSNVTAGSDGNLWFLEGGLLRTGFGRITTAGMIIEFLLPSGSAGSHIVAGPDGNLWFTERDKIGRITVENVALTEFALPTTGNLAGWITTGPDGNLWFTESDQIGRITPTGTITEFAIPTAGSIPLGITAGPDGNLWFVESSGNKIGRISPTGIITEYAIPTPDSLPVGIAAAVDHNLWFTEELGNKIGRITTDGVVTEFAVPTDGRPYDITSGPDGSVWFTDLAGRIGRLCTLPECGTRAPIQSAPRARRPIAIGARR